MDLVCRGLTDEDIELLADGLRRCAATRGPHLLDLRHNQFGDVGVQHLVLSLAGGAAPRLEELRLQGTKLTTVGRNMLQGLSLVRKGIAVKLDSLAASGADAGTGAGATVTLAGAAEAPAAT